MPRILRWPRTATARGGPRRLAAVLVTALLALALTPPPVGAAAPGTRPFAVTVTHIECVDDCDEVGLEGLFDGHADFYVKVFINGEEHRTPTRDNSPDIDPFWTVSAQVPDDLEDVPVTLQVWDEDDAPGKDDLGDASPHDDDNNLDFTVSYATGKWRDAARPSGDGIKWPQSCSSGDGETGSENDGPRVKVCWEVSTLSASGDEDGDGLLDGWERNGYNDGDGTTVDVNLPAMGADPRHKDLFLEIDSQAGHVPSRATLQAVKNAFAFAPDNAGTRATEHGGAADARPNPDGKPGITLHVDTGAPLDPRASEGLLIGDCADGRDNEHTPGSPDGDGRIDGLDGQCNQGEPLDVSYEEPALDCRDDLDNDNDGRPDDKDPDCHSGEDLGGGQILSGSPDTCELGRNFYDSKKVNFERSRRWIFRYAQSVAYTTDDEPKGKDCTPKAGQGEVGGNDFVVFDPEAEVILHELGHTLNLRHGGPDEGNCKPNYVSAMNYNYASHGINRVGGGYIVDFSPPRIPARGFERGIAPLPDLVENHLTEPTVLDATDPANEFVFTAKGGDRTPSPLNEPADWDGDGNPASGRPIDPVNLDTAGSASDPTDCTNDTSDSTLHGAEDWPFISLTVNSFGDSAEAPVNVEQDPPPPAVVRTAMAEEINTTDIGVTLADGPDPVAAGTDVTYTVTVTNHGPRPSAATVLADTLPPQAVFVTSDAGCRAEERTVNCGVGQLRPGAGRTLTITAHVPADIVHNAGGPVTLTNRVTVDNLMGPDPLPDNDTATTETTVVAVADLTVTDFTAQQPPTQLLVGEPADVTLRATVANNGPSSPMDTTLTTRAAADPEATATPASVTQPVAALATGTPRTADSTFTLRCDRPGPHTFRFTATIAPAREGDTDPEPANNHRPTELTADCVLPVAIDIEPQGTLPATVTVPHGLITVGVLTTAAGEYGLPLAFDATRIQVPTVHFGPRRVVFAGPGGSTEPHGQGHPADLVEHTDTPGTEVKDGDLDMLLHFDTETSGLQAGDTEACVKGSYTDAADGRTYRFFGCRPVRVLPY